jgi:hypothetical protein
LRTCGSNKTAAGFFKFFFGPTRRPNQNLTPRPYHYPDGQDAIRLPTTLTSEANKMISSECRFSEFMGALKGKDYYEVIQLAEREATAAERLFLRVPADAPRATRCDRDYAHRIKRLIDYLRYEVKPHARFGRDEAAFAALDRGRRPRRGI